MIYEENWIYGHSEYSEIVTDLRNYYTREYNCHQLLLL